MQEFLQHLFGFIGICTVLKWLINLYGLTIKKESEPIPITLVCNYCGGDKWSLLRSMNVKKCVDCGKEVEWKLDEGQLPLVANNRMVKRDESKKD